MNPFDVIGPGHVVPSDEQIEAQVHALMNKTWTPVEPDEVIEEFTKLLRGPTGDGAGKRRAGEKVSWKVDPGHSAAMYRHLEYWEAGEKHDVDNGSHPLVAVAWRALAKAWQEIHADD